MAPSRRAGPQPHSSKAWTYRSTSTSVRRTWIYRSTPQHSYLRLKGVHLEAQPRQHECVRPDEGTDVQGDARAARGGGGGIALAAQLLGIEVMVASCGHLQLQGEVRGCVADACVAGGSRGGKEREGGG